MFKGAGKVNINDNIYTLLRTMLTKGLSGIAQYSVMHHDIDMRRYSINIA